MGFLKHFQQNNQTLENIFQNIFWNATKHLKIFSFPENSISRKYFTWTKHSLSNGRKQRAVKAWKKKEKEPRPNGPVRQEIAAASPQAQERAKVGQA